MSGKTSPSFELTIDEFYRNKSISLNQSLAQLRSKTSLLECKIEFLTIYKMSSDMFTVKSTDVNGQTYNAHAISFTAPEIKRLMDRTGGSFYSQLTMAALEMSKKMSIYVDDKTKQFEFQRLYNKVSYKDGIFTVEFNPDTEHLFSELRDSFTSIKLDIAFKFTTIGGFNLYKLLKSESSKIPEYNKKLSQEDQQAVVFSYSLTDLRMQLGFIDLSNPDMLAEESKKNPNFEKIAAKEKKPKYKRFNDFQARVLTPGMNEINRLSDIYISSIDSDKGAHGKITQILIRVQPNAAFYTNTAPVGKTENAGRNMTDEQKESILDEIIALIGEGIKIKEARAIAEDADWNMDIIKEKYEMSKSQNLENRIGWIRRAIQGNWSPAVKQSKENKFNNFNQRDYDFEALEKEAFS